MQEFKPLTYLVNFQVTEHSGFTKR